MIAFFSRKFLAGIVLVLGVTAVTFFLVYASGSDIARNILGEGATQEQVVQKAHDLGLDQPVVVQYGQWLGKVVRGDLGRSFFDSQPVWSSLATRLPVTVSIVFFTILLASLVSILLGVLAARSPGGALDGGVQVLSVLGFAVPNYWLALVLVLAIALPSHGVIPATGYVPPMTSVGGWLLSLLLPCIALSVGTIASVAQQIRGSLIDVLSQDYIRTLRSRGLSERALVLRHGLRNAGTPALTVLALRIVGLLGGAVIVERVFALPGLGTLALNASLLGDIPVVLGVVLFMSIIVVGVNLLIDLLIAWLNPKARLS
ncbi:MAG TPA: ABC transporter permease [Devosiaceae bacterium]|jgi:peptide/nickel transport system permease protein